MLVEEISLVPEQVIATIKYDCSDYVALLAAGTPPLVRGLAGYTVPFKLNEIPRPNRDRHEENLWLEVLADRYLTELGIEAKRLQSWFATSDPNMAEQYARDDGSLYYVFPKNGVPYAHTDSTYDLHLSAENWVYQDGIDILDEKGLGEGRLAAMLHDCNGDLSTFSIYVRHSPQVMAFFYRYFLGRRGFTDQHLPQAMQRGVEVWFKGPYHMIRTDQNHMMSLLTSTAAK